MYKDKINIFMDWLYNKPIHSNWFVQLCYNLKFKRFLYDVRTTVPDFITLCHIVNFIRLLKITYFYRFNKDSYLNIIDDIVTDDNNFGFIIYQNDYNIEVKLSKQTKKISIRVLDMLESKSRNELSKVEFHEGELVIDHPIQRLQYTHLNRLIMDSVANILQYYYQYHTEDRYNGQ